MVCPGCGEKNRDGARFCTYCGTTLALRCPVCDNEVVAGGRFCDACGAAVDPSIHAPPPPPPTAAAAARKVVTVLFADLSGSTALEERMDAESVRSILDRFYAAMRAEVERFGGRVVKFTGDGVMAAFGVPDVHEDDAVRAVDAALAMREELEQLASDLSLDVKLNIGVNTGEVVVSDADDDVVGDAVNVAARLEGAATEGEILVGEETWRLTRATSRYEPVEPLTLKGKSEPVPAYRLLSVDERTSDSAAAPFVGRDAELGRLLSVFQDAVDANAARLVTIIGSPGLGKTRLARELMAELSDTARVRETRCDPAGESTFAPIADALRAASGISELDTEEDVLAKISARFAEDDPDRDRIAARAAAILGVGQPGSTEETFWAIRRMIEEAAAAQPVVFVFDDIHWAEPLMLDLVEHLAEWIRTVPVLIVGTARPELRDLRPSLAEGGRAADVIALEGLDRSATAQLALNLLGTDELPSELLAKIPASTEGNPLFVRELVRMLVDDGVLMRTADGWSVTVDVDAIQVPPTIASLLSARVDRLRNDERTVVELASVVGKEFYRGALVELAPSGVKDLVDGCLESLRRKELVEPVGTYWIDEPVYRFHHVLIRDAAYRRLLKESRADLHERVAAWLQNKTADVLGEHDELLGYHFEQAHEYKRQLGRPDDELGCRAAALLHTAAQRALDRDDLPAAAALSGRALDRLPLNDDTRPEVLLIRCEALLSMGDVARGAEAVAELDLVATTARLRAWVTCFSGHLANLTSPEASDDAEVRVAAAAAELAALGDQAGAAKAHTVRAHTLKMRGRFAECEAVLDDALTAARAANDRRRITATLGLAPHAQLWGPNVVSRAGGRCLDVVRLLRITTGSPAVEATSLRCQAVLEAFRGRADAARRMLRSAQRTLTELALEHELLEAEELAGIIELVDGDPAAAVVHFRASYEGFKAAGVDVAAGQLAAALARAHLLLGEDDVAASLLDESERLSGHGKKAAIDRRAVKAELLARRGEFDEARRMAEEAVALASETDALFDHGMACRSLATVLRAAGDAAGAQGAEDSARALFERKGATALLESDTASRETPATSAIPERRVLQNDCVLQYDRLIDAIRKRDWRAVADLQDADIVVEDRRAGLGSRNFGSDVVLEQIKAIADLGATPSSYEVVATRGQRLALVRAAMSIESGLSVDVLQVVEIGPDGRFLAYSTFEPDVLDAAFVELDERYMRGEARAFADQFRGVIAFIRHMNDRVWDEFRPWFTDAASVVDHTPAGRGEMTVDRFLSSIDELVGLTSELCVRATVVHAISDGVTLIEAHNRGVSLDGADVDLAYQTLFVHSGGSIRRMELYPAEHLGAARARFDELVATRHGTVASTGAVARDVIAPPVNRCVRALRDYIRVYEQGDWAAVEATIADDARFSDRRPGLRSELHGKAAVLENIRGMAAIFVNRVDATPVATRGSRLAMFHVRFSGDDPELYGEMVSLNSIDEDGRQDAVVVFEMSDLNAAIAELDERYIAGEGAGHAELVRAMSALAIAFTANDWPAARAVLADDVVVLDHRPALLGEIHGADTWIDSAKRLNELVDYRSDLVQWHAFGDDAAACEFRYHGATAEGAEVESAFQFVFQVRDGRIVRMEPFPVDQLEEALSRFREMSTSTQLENAAVRAIRESDRIADLAAVAGLGVVRLEHTALAIRGQRLALDKTFVESADGAQVEMLGLTEVDEDGRIASVTRFELEQFDDAVAELDARAVRLEGQEYAEIFRLERESSRAISHADWPLMSSLLADDFVLVDHRPTGWGVRRGPDAFREVMTSAPDVLGSRQVSVARFIRKSVDLALTVARVDGMTPNGLRFDASRLVLTRITDGVITRFEYFDADALDQALRRFDELSAPSGRGPLALSNASARLAARFPSTFNASAESAATRFLDRLQEAMDRRDMDGFISLHADDFVHDDRRAGIKHVTRGLDRIREYAQMSHELGYGTFRTVETLATRGERLCLTRRIYSDPRSGRDFETEQLIVDEVDAEGRVVRAVVFDPDAIDAAFIELDERYIAGDGRPFADVVRANMATMAAINRRDWDEYGRHAADGFVFVDHRPASLGAVTMRELVEANTEQTALIPDLSIRLRRYIALDVDGWLSDIVAVGHTSEGEPLDLSFVNVGQLRGEKVCRSEFFPIDRLDDALARFDELGAERAYTASVENACTRLWDRMITAGFTQRDWITCGDLVAEDVDFVDKRAGLGARIQGRASFVEQIKVVADMGPVVRCDIIATRGERLALMLVEWDDPDAGHALTVRALHVHELDDDLRLAAVVVFDPDDIDTALDDLEARFVAGEGAPHADTLTKAARQRAALKAIDWVTYSSLFADDVVLVDHRPASLGEIRGIDAVLDALRAYAPLMRDVRPIVVTYPALSSNRSLAHVKATATASHGGVVEMEHLRIQQLRDGLIARIELFPIDGLDDARRRFDELSDGAHRGADSLTNAATRIFDIGAEAIRTDEWTAMRAALADDVLVEDRRRGIHSRGVGPEAWIANYRTAAGLGFRGIKSDVMATRGDRIALTYGAMEDVNGNVMDALILTEVDESGRATAVIHFDTDDFDEAIAELDATFAQAVDASAVAIVEFNSKILRAHNAGDWGAFRSMIHENVVFLDHRPASAGRIESAEGWLRYLQTMPAMTASYRAYLRGYYALAPGRALVRQRNHGISLDGVDFDVELIVVTSMRDGRLASIEFFLPEQFAEARARFERQADQRSGDAGMQRLERFAAAPSGDEPDAAAGPSRSGLLHNACTRTWDAMCLTFAEHRWDEHAKRMAPDIIFEDRRPGLQNVIAGLDSCLEVAKTIGDIGPVLETKVLAVRGDRLALYHEHYHAANYEPRDVHVELLNVLEVDAEGRIARATNFEVDDIDEAFAELDERFAAGEAGDAVDMIRLGLRTFPVWNGQDWDALAALWYPDIIFVDHRQLSPGEVRRDELLSMVQSLAEMIPDVRHRIVAMPMGDRGIVLTQIVAEGTNTEGGRVEFSYLQIACARDSRYTRIERFELDRFDDAVARFEELRGRSPDADRRQLVGVSSGFDRFALENSATRFIERLRVALELADVRAFLDLHADSFTLDDQRAGLRHVTRGLDELHEYFRAGRAVGLGRFQLVETLAIRGERLALTRRIYTGPEDGTDFETERLIIDEVDADERVVNSVFFDPHDLDAAFDELDERYRAGEGRPYGDILRIAKDQELSYNERDWTAYRSRLDDDTAFIDHRAAGAGAIMGAERLIGYLQGLIDLASDARLRTSEIIAVAPDRLLARHEVRGSTAEGAEIELAFFVLYETRDHRVARMEVFPLDEHDGVVAGFKGSD